MQCNSLWATLDVYDKDGISKCSERQEYDKYYAGDFFTQLARDHGFLKDGKINPVEKEAIDNIAKLIDVLPEGPKQKVNGFLKQIREIAESN